MVEKKLVNKKAWFSFLVILLLLISLLPVTINAQEVKYCCERTTYGAWCMNVGDEQYCDDGYRKTPTSCEATSFCRLGCCYDSSEGICMENTPQKVCDQEEGTWAEGKECDIPQCQLGCCVIGTQAAFVTLTRCKKLSAFYGLLTDFRRNIGTELECISLASLADEGACVYEADFAKTCKFTSRQECNTIKEGMKVGEGKEETATVTGNIEFHKDFLCSAEDLSTNCGMTKDTTCVEGKDEVYFLDSCGNPANIYDSSKADDKAYWRKKISKAESCSPDSANINSKSCGNCNYFDGSICSKGSASYGNYICKDLHCKATDTSDGKARKHGESWCSTDKNIDSVGSRYFRHLCMNGEEIIEPCADFRQEICIEDVLETSKGKFSQAACRVNRWQECYSQKSKVDCENKDRRDCKWAGGEEDEKVKCVPEHAPGLTFWEQGDAQGVCGLVNTQCVVTFEKTGLIFGKEPECTENCECLAESWQVQQLGKCQALGDCGAKVNYVGAKGSKSGYKISEKKYEESEQEEGGGLFGIHLLLSKLGLTGKIAEDLENTGEAENENS